MKPKGHKRGCRCVVCSPATRKRVQRRNHGYENQAAALTLHDRAAENPRRKRRKNSTIPLGGQKTTRGRNAELELNRFHRRNPGDYDKAHDLELYIKNTGGELQDRIRALRTMLVRKYKRGTYDRDHAVRAWNYIADDGARMYTREFRTGGRTSFGMFNAETRRLTAQALAADFTVGLELGEWDYLYPPKTNPRRRRNTSIRIAGNPTSHYPRTTRGPKGNVRWYILDLKDGRGNLISSRYRKCAHSKCATEAAGLVDRKVGKKMVRKVELSGPYSRKPNAKTTRK